MSLRALISRIAVEYPQYRGQRKVNKTALAYQVVTNEFPSLLRGLLRLRTRI